MTYINYDISEKQWGCGPTLCEDCGYMGHDGEDCPDCGKPTEPLKKATVKQAQAFRVDKIRSDHRFWFNPELDKKMCAIMDRLKTNFGATNFSGQEGNKK